MPFIKTNDGTEIYYKDWGSGQPIVFHHGWPLSADDWDTQMLFFFSRDIASSLTIAEAMDARRKRPAATIWIRTPKMRRRLPMR